MRKRCEWNAESQYLADQACEVNQIESGAAQWPDPIE
jgi:hypothetical protein